jgi:diguanylate cyclase (GGDEF)-like protein/PAS domain S-box-containing protein
MTTQPTGEDRRGDAGDGPGFFEGVIGTIRDGVALLGSDGHVSYANEALAELLRMPLDDLVGANGLELIHPDELDRALDAIVFATQFPERSAVVPFRLRRGDGTYVDVELKSGAVPGPDGTDLLALVVRDGTTRTTVAAAIATIANDEPLAATATELARAITSRWPNTGAMVVFDTIGDEWQTVADGVPEPLRAWVGPVSVIDAEHDASGTDRRLREPADRRAPQREGDRRGRSTPAPRPWDLALAQQRTVVVELDAMPEALAADARAAGFAACAVAPVDDPSGGSACLIAWFDEPAVAHLEFAHSVVELAKVLRLACERHYHLEQLGHAATHDPLTGLANRSGFFAAFDERLAANERDGTLALFFVDLDGFKPINDRHGHSIGDRVLVEVAWRLGHAVGADDIVGRLGGDEFALVCLVPAAEAIPATNAIAQRVLTALTQPMMVGQGDGPLVGPLKISASVGVALIDAEADAQVLLDRADSAMYAAKAAGGARSRVWQLS